jgi:hypothetical protein
MRDGRQPGGMETGRAGVTRPRGRAVFQPADKVGGKVVIRLKGTELRVRRSDLKFSTD